MLAILAVALASLRDMFSDEQTKRLVPIGLAAVAAFFMMLSLRRKQRAPRPPRELSPPPRRPEAGPELRRDLDALMVELQELSRKISAEIDTRFAKLEAAMRDADRRIAVLNRLTRGQDGAAASEPGAAADLDGRHHVVYELADAGLTPVEIARDLGKTPGEVELILNLRKRPERARPEPNRQV